MYEIPSFPRETCSHTVPWPCHWPQLEAVIGCIHRAYHHCIRQQSYAKHCSSPGLLFSGAEILQSDTLKVYSTHRLCPACDGSHSQPTPTYCIPGAPDRPASPDSTSSVAIRYFPPVNRFMFLQHLSTLPDQQGTHTSPHPPNSQHVTYLPSKPVLHKQVQTTFHGQGSRSPDCHPSSMHNHLTYLPVCKMHST